MSATQPLHIASFHYSFTHHLHLESKFLCLLFKIKGFVSIVYQFWKPIILGGEGFNILLQEIILVIILVLKV